MVKSRHGKVQVCDVGGAALRGTGPAGDRAVRGKGGSAATGEVTGQRVNRAVRRSDDEGRGIVRGDCAIQNRRKILGPTCRRYLWQCIGTWRVLRFIVVRAPFAPSKDGGGAGVPGIISRIRHYFSGQPQQRQIHYQMKVKRDRGPIAAMQTELRLRRPDVHRRKCMGLLRREPISIEYVGALAGPRTPFRRCSCVFA